MCSTMENMKCLHSQIFEFNVSREKGEFPDHPFTEINKLIHLIQNIPNNKNKNALNPSSRFPMHYTLVDEEKNAGDKLISIKPKESVLDLFIRSWYNLSR